MMGMAFSIRLVIGLCCVVELFRFEIVSICPKQICSVFRNTTLAIGRDNDFLILVQSASYNMF